MVEKIIEYYLNKEEPHKSCFLALRSIIFNQDENISETVKYGMPCFCYKKTPICYLWSDRKNGEPYILMVEGKYLNHPKLEQGNRSRMKILRINPNDDIPIETIKFILEEAVVLCKNKTNRRL